jgi:hypothetical protein
MRLHAILTVHVLLGAAMAQSRFSLGRDYHGVVAAGATITEHMQLPANRAIELVVRGDGWSPLEVRVLDARGKVVQRRICDRGPANIPLPAGADTACTVDITNLGDVSNSVVVQLW